MIAPVIDLTERLRAKLLQQSARLAEPVDSGGGGGNDGDMEARVAKLESDVEYIKRDIAEIKTDIREVKGDFKDIRKEMHSDFIKLFVYGIVATLAVAGLMAHGFKWI